MEFYNILKEIYFLIAGDLRLFLFITTLITFYFYFTSTFDYFEKKGIPYMKPVFLFGNIGPWVMATKSFHQLQLEIYEYFKGKPFGGIFHGRKPVLYIFDPDLIKAVTIRDFDCFTDRLTLNSKEPIYIRRFLLNLKGSNWKAVRRTMTPAFSSARLRNVLPLIQICAKQMVEFLKEYEYQEVEMKKTMGHFTLEVIGACAFGIKCDALNSERSHFLQVAEEFDCVPTHKRMLMWFVMIFMPEMMPYFKVSLLNLDSTDELMRMLKAVKEERQSNNTKHNDFLQILMDFTNKEKMKIEESGSKLQLDADTLDGQCMLFLIAGYETSSTLLSFAIHVLATKPDIQEKLRNHITEMTEGKEITYDLISKLSYLDGFLLETLRVYPPVARIDKLCTKPYKIPGSSVILKAGDAVVIPVNGIHMDPNIYPDPHLFRPERFLNEEKKERPSHLFLAFSVGPRNCIGFRFAMLSAKVAMIALMKNFKFTACAKTVDPVPLDNTALLIKAADGVWARVESL